MTTEEFTGLALDARIRVLVTNRSWYRAHRETYPWRDLEADNADELRLLLRVRREGRKAQRAADRHWDRFQAEVRAAHDAAEWAASVSVGRYIILPDVPLADAGDHFVGRP